MSEAPKPPADSHAKDKDHGKDHGKEKGHGPDKGHDKAADHGHAVDAHAHDTHDAVHGLVGAQMATSLPYGSYTLGALRDAPLKRGAKGMAKVAVGGGLLITAPVLVGTSFVGYKAVQNVFRLPGLRYVRDRAFAGGNWLREKILGKRPERKPDERSVMRKAADAMDDANALAVVTPLKVAYSVPRDAFHSAGWALDKTFGNVLRGLRGLTVKDKSDHTSVAHDVGIAVRTMAEKGYNAVRYLVQQPFKHPYAVGIPLAAFTTLAVTSGGIGPAFDILASKGTDIANFLGKLGAKILAKF